MVVCMIGSFVLRDGGAADVVLGDWFLEGASARFLPGVAMSVTVSGPLFSRGLASL